MTRIHLHGAVCRGGIQNPSRGRHMSATCPPPGPLAHDGGTFSFVSPTPLSTMEASSKELFVSGNDGLGKAFGERDGFCGIGHDRSGAPGGGDK